MTRETMKTKGDSDLEPFENRELRSQELEKMTACQYNLALTAEILQKSCLEWLNIKWQFD